MVQPIGRPERVPINLFDMIRKLEYSIEGGLIVRLSLAS